MIFLHKCKCVNYIQASEKYNQLQNCFFDDDGINIVRSEVLTNSQDDALFEITFSLVLKLNSVNKETLVKTELQTFLNCLDTISVF